MDPQIGRNAQTRGVQNAWPKSHPRGRERLRNEHICTTLQMKNTITEVVKQKQLRCFDHVTSRTPESYVPEAYREDISNPRPRDWPPKQRVTRCEKPQGSLSLPQSAEHRALVIGVQSAVWRAGKRYSWDGLATSQKAPLKAMSPKLIEKISKIN